MNGLTEQAEQAVARGGLPLRENGSVLRKLCR